MSFRSLLVAKAAACLIFGPLLLLVPDRLATLLGMSLGPAGRFVAGLYGASVIGNLMLTWLARDTPPSRARLPIIIALLAYDGTGFVVTLLAILGGVVNSLGWAVAAMYLFLTVVPAYLLFPRGVREPSVA